MSFKRLFVITVISYFSLSEISCINQLGITFPSINKRKKIRKIAPTFEFTHALFNYRQKYGYWPKSETDLSSSNSEAIKGIYNSGFENWNLGYFSDDTLYVYWVHEPIIDGTHVGIIPIPDKKIYLKSRYIFPNRLVTTKNIRRKQFFQDN
ncbi:hypothetical protein [Dyadobacter sp. NIV53]|uniref:hypothetical protein n=1 Tax=Dyadobacter sp. NIV53 TaxID=2861765 RepID=UPI001C86BBDC|nr:hypothetical protein [Dyadobacter sp. NIV53]